MTKIKVAIADDEELFRVGMVYILSKDPEIEIVFEAANGKQLMNHLATNVSLPDIVIVDIKMPKLNGVEATKQIRETYPAIGIVALTTYNTKPFIRNMIDVGASAYLVKNSTPQKVLHTIKQVFNYGFYYDDLVMKVLNSRRLNSEADAKTVFDSDFFTERERDVLKLICLQHTTSEIAQKLFISPRTVEVYRKNLLEKAKVKNVAGLVIYAINNALVPPIL